MIEGVTHSAGLRLALLQDLLDGLVRILCVELSSQGRLGSGVKDALGASSVITTLA